MAPTIIITNITIIMVVTQIQKKRKTFFSQTPKSIYLIYTLIILEWRIFSERTNLFCP